MFSIKRLNNETLALEFLYNGNEYEITAGVRPQIKEISINVCVKYLYQKDYYTSVCNKYFIGNYPIVYRTENTNDDRSELEIPLNKTFGVIKDLQFKNIDKVVFEIFSVKIQDLYMEVKHA